MESALESENANVIWVGLDFMERGLCPQMSSGLTNGATIYFLNLIAHADVGIAERVINSTAVRFSYASSIETLRYLGQVPSICRSSGSDENRQ